MAKRRVLLDEITVYTYHPNGPRPIGTIGCDSNSGRPWGTLGERIRAAGEGAKRPGFVSVPGPVHRPSLFGAATHFAYLKNLPR